MFGWFFRFFVCTRPRGSVFMYGYKHNNKIKLIIYVGKFASFAADVSKIVVMLRYFCVLLQEYGNRRVSLCSF